jgi:Zn-dependent metalloprotease
MSHALNLVREMQRLTVAAIMLTGPLLVAPPAAHAAAPSGLERLRVTHSLLGTHTWYRQLADGYPVLGAYYAEHVDAGTGATTVDDGRRSVAGLIHLKTTMTREAAVRAARARTPGSLQRAEMVVVAEGRPTVAWSVISDGGAGSTRTLLDASNGKVLAVRSLVKDVDGGGSVFDPNPAVRLQRDGLRDGTPAASFERAYRDVTLPRLNGAGKLRGAYAFNANPDSKQAVSRTNTFFFTRNEPGFEQVMAYYAITHTQLYIHGLGFKAVNSEPQDFRTVGLDDDNSFYDPDSDRITFGTGGVDDAEDIEVIWHEYGHAIQDAQVPGFGSSAEAGAIGEGFGDYWAYSMSSERSKDTIKTPLACIADWDAVSYTTTTPHCLRRTDGTKRYPADVVDEVHGDGEIWSRALTDIHRALGRTKADRIVLEAQFRFSPNITFKAAAQKTVAAARSLYGRGSAAAVTAAFHARGIL